MQPAQSKQSIAVEPPPRPSDQFFTECSRFTSEIHPGFSALVERLTTWCQFNRNSISEATLVKAPNDRFIFMVASTNGQYDRELDDNLSNLDLEVHHGSAFKGISLHVLAVPPIMLRDFAQRHEKGMELPNIF